MRKSKTKTWNRILALLLSLTMVIGLVPISAFATEMEEPDEDGTKSVYTILVKDAKTENPIEGAKVAYTISAADLEEEGTSETGDIKTDAEGKAEIEVASEFIDLLEKGETVTVICTVSKDKYSTVENKKFTLNSEDDLKETAEIALERTVVSITFNSSGNGKGTATVNKNKPSESVLELNGAEEAPVADVTKDKKVSVTIEADENSFIKSVKADGQEVEISEDEKTCTWSGNVSEDTAFEVEFGAYYTVTRNAGENGTLLLEGKEKNLTVKEGSEIKVTVTPDPGYEISSVIVDDTSLLEQRSGEKFEKDITITENTMITASFVKVYTIGVEYDSEKGELTCDPKCEAGKVITLENGDNFSLTATPFENYRVSKVVKREDGTDSEFSFKDNSATYTDTIENVAHDYAYVITFAPNWYDVTAEAVNADPAETDKKGGQVNITKADVTSGDSSKVNHGSEAVFEVAADEGYNISSITVNGTEIQPSEENGSEEGSAPNAVKAVVTGDNIVRVTVSNVTQDVEVKAEFSKIGDDGFDLGNVAEINSGATVRNNIDDGTAEEMLLVYPAEGKFEISLKDNTDFSKLFIIIENAAGRQITKDGKKIELWKKDIGSDAVITKVIAKEKGFWFRWSEISINPIRIIFDENAPRAEITLDDPHAGNGGKEFYNHDFDVKVSAEDTPSSEGGENYSAIQSVEYALVQVDNAQKTINEKLWNGLDQSAIQVLYPGEQEADPADLTFTVDAEDNNCPNLAICVKVTDTAGNSSVTGKIVHINTVPPTVTISMDGTVDENAEEGYYQDTRKAIVTITDRSDTFDQVEAEKAINASVKIEKVKKDENESAYALDWKTEDAQQGIYCAEITFDKTGKYGLSDINYTNIAGLSNTGTVISDSSENTGDFTILKKSPSAEITDGSNGWDSLLETITFGIWNPNTVTYRVEDAVDDLGEDVKKISYYKYSMDADTDAGLPSEELSLEEKLIDLYQRGLFSDDPCTIGTEGINEKAVVYAAIMDKAGRLTFIGTDGTIFDASQSAITFTPDEPNSNGIYNGDVNVVIEVNDLYNQTISSGISKIEYWVTKGGKDTVDNDGNAIEGVEVTQRDVLYQFEYTRNEENTGGEYKETDHSNPNGEDIISEGSGPRYEDLKKEWTGSVIVDSEKNNSSEVYVHVSVTDNAGNTTEAVSQKLDIDITTPEITVSYDNNEDASGNPDTDNKGKGYFNNERTAHIAIKERTDHFDQERAEASIHITGKDSAGIDINEENMPVITWETVEGDTPDDAVHTATIVYSADANYEFAYYEDLENSIAYTDQAGNSVSIEKIVVGDGTIHPWKFTVDKTDPTAEVKVAENVWKILLEKLTFGLYSNSTVEVTASAEDATSPYLIKYYKTSSWNVLKEEELKEIKDWEDFADFEVSANEQFVVYLKVADYAGNVIYICSDGQIVDKTPAVVELTPDEPNENGIYNSNVNVEIAVKDNASGIRKIEYWVTKDGEETQRQTLYSFDYTRDSGDNSNGGKLIITDWADGTEKVQETEGGVPTYEQLKKSWNGRITVDASKNNSCNVIVHVEVTDNAGNVNKDEAEAKLDLDIDITAPAIDLTYDNNTDNQGNTYFNKNRTATVKITERTHHFDAKAATEGITIKAVDAKGEEVEINPADMISEWDTSEGKTPDEAVHTARIAFKTDANYTLKIEYTDKAGNKNTKIDTHNSVAPFRFTVDKLVPFGTVKGRTEDGREITWDELENYLTFGFWANEKITVTGTSDDLTSPVVSVQYYKTDKSSALKWSQLDAVKEWKKFTAVQVRPNEQFTIYLKITDKAGNYNYISTDGMIVDDTAPREETIAPVITVKPEQPVNGIYNRDVKVNIEIEDPTVGNTWSGLKTVSYRVTNMGKETQSGVLYSFEKKNPTREELRKTWKGSIVVDSKKNNSNDVVIEVFAQDNSLNSSRDKVAVKIDITKPTINIRYNNNSPDSGKYYKSDRVATVTVTERNFDPEAVKVIITNTDGTIPSISGWSTSKAGGNGDGTTHTATITYHADGDYTFRIGCTDKASNQCDGETYAAGTTNPKEFTIDQTDPVVTVGYSNNSVKNGVYFKKARTATITIKEHNFDVGRVKIKQTASLNGKAISVPGVSWSSRGDIHTATIVYNKDGDYTFDITMDDMAGNASGAAGYGNSAAGKKFTVDTHIDKPKITGVENGKSYKKDVILNIDFSDINFDSDHIKLVRTCKDEINVDVTDEFIKGLKLSAKGGQGVFDTFKRDQKNDGIYTLTVKVSDKAGNEETQKVKFTVNRFGSVYELDRDLIALRNTYIQEIGQDQNLVITEYNADRLLADSLKIEITRDGAPISDVSYKVNPVMNNEVKTGESGWYEYRYVLDHSNFTEDGVYKVTVSSEDTAGNKPETSNYKNCDIMFYVDSTPADITGISGMEEAIVNTDKQKVSFEVFDAMGLKKITVYVDGKVVQELDQFDDANNAVCEFTLDEKSDAQHIRMQIEDMAGNITDTDAKTTKTEEYVFQPSYSFNREIIVSTNAFVRWYANKPLFQGTIAGIIGIAAIILFIFVMGRRKKEDGEAQS